MNEGLLLLCCFIFVFARGGMELLIYERGSGMNTRVMMHHEGKVI